MSADRPEVICPTCGTWYYEDSEAVVWIGYQPFHGDCLANFLITLAAQPMKRAMLKEEASARASNGSMAEAVPTATSRPKSASGGAAPEQGEKR